MRDARKPLHDYVGEAEVRAACDRLGVLETAQADFIEEFRAGLFDRDGIADHIEKSRETKPQRWAGQGADDELFVQAFGETPSITAQGAVVKKYGEARANEVAANFGAKIGSTKPGKVPEHIKKTNGNGHDKGGNPFAKLRNADGTVNKTVEADTGRMITALGRKKCEDIARAAGKTISGLPLRQ